MPVQTTYEIEHVASVEGAVVDGQLKNINSGPAVGAVPFGRIVTRENAAGAVALPNASDDVTIRGMGAAVRMQDQVADASDVLQYEDEQDVSILDFGVIYLRPEDAVTYGAPVFVRFAAGGGGTALGSVRSDADTATAVALPGAKFMSSAAGGALCPVRIRLS